MYKKLILITIGLLMILSYSLFAIDANVRVWGIDAPSRNRTLPIEITINNNVIATVETVFSEEGGFHFTYHLSGDIEDDNILTLTCEGKIIYQREIEDIMEYDSELFINEDNTKVLVAPLESEAMQSLEGKFEQTTKIALDGENHIVNTQEVGVIIIDAKNSSANTVKISADETTLQAQTYVIVINPSNKSIKAFTKRVRSGQFKILIFDGDWRYQK
ncbi:MAG: hypothetical protein B7C24_10570 [Bacteroidetes bacterium 4572_77]|nr:MAG: hypothetical protein B7C24_10570 [Bacteroidetes bacterium 4572_77]